MKQEMVRLVLLFWVAIVLPIFIALFSLNIHTQAKLNRIDTKVEKMSQESIRIIAEPTATASSTSSAKKK